MNGITKFATNTAATAVNPNPNISTLKKFHIPSKSSSSGRFMSNYLILFAFLLLPC